MYSGGGGGGGGGGGIVAVEPQCLDYQSKHEILGC